MKKIVALAILPMLLLLGCSKLEFNSPALIGKKDGERWKSIEYRAHIDENGVLKVTGTDGAERITLVFPNATLKSHDLKGDLVAEAQFLDANGNAFSTKNEPHPSVSLYPADGSVELVEYDIANNTVTGLFNFNAYRADGLAALNFSAGNFYQVPITGGPIITDGDTVDKDEECKEAKKLVDDAQKVYVQISDVFEPGSEEYLKACEAYKAALVSQKALCGDSDGSIQKIIDQLGDCKGTSDDDGNDDDEPEDDAFYAELDGKEFKEDVILGQVETQQGFSGIVFGASIGDTQSIAMAVPTDIKEGEYTVAQIGALSIAWSYFMGQDYRNQAIPTSIKLTILKHNVVKKFIKATFEFDAKDKDDETKIYKIRKGEISVSY